MGASASWTEFGLQNYRKMLQVGPRWSQNGAKLGQDGAKMAPSWPPRRILGRSWAIFAVLACPGTPWGGIWDPRGPIWTPKTLPRSTPNPPKIDQKSVLFFDTVSSCILKRFFEDLGSMLAPISKVFGHPKRLQTASADFLKKCTAPQREHDFRGQKPPEIDAKSMQNRCGS